MRLAVAELILCSEDTHCPLKFEEVPTSTQWEHSVHQYQVVHQVSVCAYKQYMQLQCSGVGPPVLHKPSFQEAPPPSREG